MSRTIILDSTPLALLVQKRDYRQAEQCRDWARRHIAAGNMLIVPAIAAYEVRRELLRLAKTRAISNLDRFIGETGGRFLPLTDPALRLAAELWAAARRLGRPTADPQALDADVILAAQVLDAGFPSNNLVVATSNVRHLSQFVAAEEWDQV